jgi:DNA-binding response OmpR family regulator
MSHTVLVVEDTELLRRMYSDRLAQDGHRVLQAADGLAALSVLREETPDLILLDLVMPNVSGLEVLDAIKKDPRLADIPVLILTNLGEESDIERGMAMGALDYLIKNDVRPNDIAQRVTSIVSSAAVQDRRASFRLVVQAHAADADAFISAGGLPRGMWCPACQVELNLEVVPDPARPGWYSAHVICPQCARVF